MEFLMTYGWAILVVLAAVGALAYFGILNPSRFLPDSCNMGAGIGCVEFKGNSQVSWLNGGGCAGAASGCGALQVVLQNNLGADLTSASVQFTDSSGGTCAGVCDGNPGAGTCPAVGSSAYEVASGSLPASYIAKYHFTNVRNGDRFAIPGSLAASPDIIGIQCTSYVTKGAKANVQVNITYTKAGSRFSNTVEGEIRARMA